MVATNLQPWKTLTYYADTSKEITTKNFDDTKITLDAYTIDTNRLNRIAPSKRISGTPSIKLRPIALGNLHNPVCGNWSDAVTLGTALLAGEGVEITIDKTDPIFAKNILGVQIAIQPTAGETFKVCGSLALPSEFVREGKVPTSNIVYKLDNLEGGWPLITEVKELAPAQMYGIIPEVLNFGLGEDGITLPLSIKSFDSSTDGVDSTFKYGATFGINFSVNPADEVQLRNIMMALGFNFLNEKQSNYGTALQSVPNVIVLDLDLPYIYTETVNRYIAFGINNQTLSEATLSAAINKKDPFEVQFKWFKTPYFHQSQQVSGQAD